MHILDLLLEIADITRPSAASTTSALGPATSLAAILSAVAAMAGVVWAVRSSLVDRALRERPYIVFKSARYLEKERQTIEDGAVLRNVGLGPALDVRLQHQSIVRPKQGGRAKMSPAAVTRISSLTPDESMSAGDLGGLVTTYLKALYIKGEADYRRESRDAPAEIDLQLDVLYRDRGRKYYYQTARLKVFAEIYTTMSSISDMSILGSDDPMIDHEGDDLVGVGLHTGLYSVTHVEMGEQEPIPTWYFPSTRLKRIKRDLEQQFDQ